MSFEAAMAWLLPIEGGYVNHPADPGRATNYGVTQATYDAYRAGLGLKARDVRHIGKSEATAIYRANYWARINGDARPYGEALAVFDFAVHSGVTRALDYWQRAEDVRHYLRLRREFLTDLDAFATFGRGWMRRLNKLEAEVEKVVTPLAVEQVVIYAGTQEIPFRPTATSTGRTDAGRRKLMVRI